MSAAGWEHFEVEADVGVRAWGATRAQALAQATLGVFALIVMPAEVEPRERREVRAQADGAEALLVAWIDECLYVHDIEGFVVHDVELSVCTDTLAHGVLHGEPLDPARHRVGTVVKGATYHEVKVAVRNGVHEVKVIVDV
ncbi:MAG: archease [Candidatus Rokuibacteriota bacterium]|nr:MAG: archease [Candidatus Rokubacteria bacterium]